MKIKSIADIDKNFIQNTEVREDTKWYLPTQPPFRLTGIYFDEASKMYRRFPKEVGEQIGNIAMAKVTSHTAGGRLSFCTDSSYVEIKAIVPYASVSNCQPLNAYYGFGVYIDNIYLNSCCPKFRDIANCEDYITFEYEEMQHIPIIGHFNLPSSKKMHQVDICFPGYNGVLEIYIGLRNGSIIQEPAPFSYDKKIVFYGSSISQGGSTSHSGNDYISMIGRQLNVEVLNLGFSGNCRGEKGFAEFMGTLDAGAYYVGYDYNARSITELEERHYIFYETLRKTNSTTPIILASRPRAIYDEESKKRRAIVYETYQKAIENGDKNVYFIDGERLFGSECRDYCTVDGCHPNDLGFYRMAQYIAPIIKNIIKIRKGKFK